MNNEKFVNVYIDILQKTLNDWLLQNVSLQANSKVTEDVVSSQAETIQELNGKVEELTKTVNDIQQGKQNETDSQLKTYKDKVENLENAIRDHLNTISNLNTMKSEYENIKHQAQHVDTFRNELLKEREEHQKTRRELETKLNDLTTKHNSDLDNTKEGYEKQIKELGDKIEYLQLTPAKRKKIEEEKAKLLSPTELFQVAEIKTEPKTDTIVEDGGTF
jgi:chromosome segregation ATPase